MNSFTYIVSRVNDKGLINDAVKLNIFRPKRQLMKPRLILRSKASLSLFMNFHFLRLFSLPCEINRYQKCISIDERVFVSSSDCF